MDARGQALSLMRRMASGSLDVETFCREYEELFNFNWPNRGAEKDLATFKKIFDVIVYFTPYPEEKQTHYLGYKTAPEVLALVQGSLNELGA